MFSFCNIKDMINTPPEPFHRRVTVESLTRSPWGRCTDWKYRTYWDFFLVNRLDIEDESYAKEIFLLVILLIH
jgi:hypothetical protein